MNDLTVVENSSTPNILQPADIEGSVAFFDNYEELTRQLLKPSDYQKQGKKSFKKKSAWRKYATAFNLSDEILSKEVTRDESHRIVSAEFMVKVTAPNGREAVGVGACSIFDKIKTSDVEEPSTFELRKRFSNAENDVISTAHTRAKSRAISDIIGTGEVGADEIEDAEDNLQSRKQKKTKKQKKKKKIEPHIEDENGVIEAEVVSEDGKKSKTLKELIDSNKNIRKAVDIIQEDETAMVNRANIQDKLLDMFDLGKLTAIEYNEAKELLE